MTATETATTSVGPAPAPFDRFAGVAGVLGGASALGYAISFLVLSDAQLAALFLLLSGFLASPLWVAVHLRVRGVGSGFAEWGTALVLLGAVGSAVHGAHDLAATVAPPPGRIIEELDPIDPRGVLTFGAAGVGLFVLASLFLRYGAFPRWLGWTGLLSAVLLVVLYIGRLVVVDPGSPIIAGPAVVDGFVVGPLVLVGLGAHLLRPPRGTIR